MCRTSRATVVARDRRAQPSSTAIYRGWGRGSTALAQSAADRPHRAVADRKDPDMLSARTTRSLTVALCSVTLGLVAFAPTASAMPQDLRDAGETSSLSGLPPQDLRSPDARDAAVQSAQPQDLRSPDTRDIAQDYAPPAPATPVAQSSDGFDWVSAAIGVAIVGGVLVLVIATVGSRRSAGRRDVAGT